MLYTKYLHNNKEDIHYFQINMVIKSLENLEISVNYDFKILFFRIVF